MLIIFCSFYDLKHIFSRTFDQMSLTLVCLVSCIILFLKQTILLTNLSITIYFNSDDAVSTFVVVEVEIEVEGLALVPGCVRGSVAL